MEQYSIILPNEKTKTNWYVTVFILLINLLVFGFIYIKAIDQKIIDFSLWATVVCSFSFLMLLIFKYTGKRYGFLVEISFVLLSIFWFLLGRYLLSLSILCFAIIGFYSMRKFEVKLNKEGISYPSFPMKFFLWKDVSNVILKDNMLTIDLKDNKLLQSVVDIKSALAINETEFNLFCQERLGEIA